METFLTTLTQMLTLFTFIAIGFTLTKTKILPDSASKAMAKLETWILLPSLSFMAMLRYCTIESLATHGTNIILSGIILVIAILIAIFLSRLFVKEKGIERGVYIYGLTIANISYIGDPIVIALFGEQALAYYKLFCLPLLIFIYTIGISLMIPKSDKKGASIKRLLNPTAIALFIGVILGLLNAENYIPKFLISTLDSAKACVAPIAMLLAGVTIARFDFIKMLKNTKVYVASILRLIVVPTILVALLFGIVTLVNHLFNFNIGYDVLFLCFFAYCPPLGLNSVVFPEAYGGNPETGASMALISHTICVITIPMLYMLMVALFGVPFTNLI